MAEATGKEHARRQAQRERAEVVAVAQAERQAVRQTARDERLVAARAQAREHQERRRAEIQERERQRESEREAKRDAMRALVPEWEGLSDAALRYRAKMATMTPDQREAFHRAKNAAHAAKLAEKGTGSKARPDEVRERRNAKRRAQRADAKARGDVGGTL